MVSLQHLLGSVAMLLGSSMATDGADLPDVGPIPPSLLEQTYATSADQFLTIDGARVRVRIEGPNNAPPIILLHGFTFSLETWNGWAADLSQDYRVIRYDLLGHGLTGPDPSRRYSPEERAAFLGAVMDALGIDSAIIGGNSLGGLAAWRFADQSPERVEKLILVSPGAYPMNGAGEVAAPVPPLVGIYLRTAPEISVRAGLDLIYSDPVSAERFDQIHHLMRREGNGEAFVQSLEVFTLPDPTQELSSLEMPVLIQWGLQDAVIPAEHGTKMDKIIPNAILRLYDAIGHVPHEEWSTTTVRDVRAFLTESLSE